VYVVTVVPGAPAEKAGLKAGGTDQNGAPARGGDVITAIGGTPVTSVTDIQNYLAGKRVGDAVTLTIMRGGASTSASVTLGARPADTTANPSNPPVPSIPGFPWRNR
jgi:S1-C subfamily serine protease